MSTHLYASREKKRERLNNFVLNKCSFLNSRFDLPIVRGESLLNRRAGQNEFMTRRFLYGGTRSYASNRKYRERGNSEIGVNERILRQATIKELVSLRRLRAFL